MTLKQLHARAVAWIDSPGGKRTSETVSRVLLASTLAFLIYRLTRVGWGEIMQSVPMAPAFYLLFAVNYFLLPFSEALSFRLTWKFDFWRGLPAFFRKHVYNHDVIDYSGEVYLYVWATKTLRRSEGEALRTIKDNSILSSVCGFIVAMTMPLACFAVGQLAPQRNFSTTEITAIIVAPLLVGVACVALWIFRQAIFFLPATTLAQVGGIHLGRFLLINLLTIVQWSVVMPAEPIAVWCTLLAAQNLIGRLPSVLRKDLIFIAAGVELSGGLSVPAAAVAGMLLVGSVLDSVTNALIFSTSMFAGRDENLEPQAVASEPAADSRLAEACYENAA
jgi:hypothetical protein